MYDRVSVIVAIWCVVEYCRSGGFEVEERREDGDGAEERSVSLMG